MLKEGINEIVKKKYFNNIQLNYPILIKFLKYHS